MTFLLQQQAVATTTTTTTNFHLPQHTHNLLLSTPQIRILETTTYDATHSCAPPPPQNKSYFNPQTNETLYLPATEVQVSEIGILFDYEIFHESDVTWGDVNDIEEDKGWFDKAGDFFGNLFGGDDDKEEEGEQEEDIIEEDESDGDGKGNENLLELEEFITDEVWKSILENDGMTWDGQQCMGLVIEDDIARGRRLRRLQDIVDDVDEAPTVDTVDQVVDDAPPDTNEFSGTKLLGITWQPLDYVNPNGCVIKDPTCTSIRGQVSTAYAGDNEYGVVKAVIAEIQYVMDYVQFVPSDSDPVTLEFVRGGGTAEVGSKGNIILLEREEPEEEEESYLSKYGVLFVCLVAILGAGFIAAMVMRYKKRQRAKAICDGQYEMSEEEFEANLALQEENIGKTDAEADSSRTESPQDAPQFEKQVELDIPPVNSGDSDVEISYSGGKSWNDVVVDL